MLKLILQIWILTLGISLARATSCHELHQSQLISLNERMNQMIDTISSMLPKPLKKPKAPEPFTPTSPAEYLASASGYESPYTSSTTYTPLPQTPHIMYVSPSYSPVPSAVIAPSTMQPNSLPLLPSYYSQIETGLPVEYAFQDTSNLTPRYTRSHYQYETTPNPIPVSNPSPLSYPPISFSHFQQYPNDYNRPSPSEYPLAVPVYPNMPPYTPGLPHFSLPTYTMQPPQPRYA